MNNIRVMRSLLPLSLLLNFHDNDPYPINAVKRSHRLPGDLPTKPAWKTVEKLLPNRKVSIAQQFACKCSFACSDCLVTIAVNQNGSKEETQATMLTFSITAPMLSDEDDRKEHESLSPQEKEAIENDVFGKDGFVETPAMIHQGLVQMSEAIAAIAPEEKQAYLRALKVAPELVANESKMLYFLRAERFNYWSSAERFVAYWEARSQWFGENAFRPMTCTEQGALSEDAMRLLSKAMWVKGGTDDKGRVVVLFNRSLLERSRQFRTAAVSRSRDTCGL